ncbi:ATP-dependent carboxylate-amine ligase domain protein ATP-grasp [Arcobacter nitrofigilis DSM 7299]|uniref:ATP-dependent carboxylate-amine ligase domain protein ATP-grasp n=1 Tax=Arcobacter nitrofigilis (strain ATCC 33309 / DSM 7299 / CCUG 15893 / LMG 7604 / NCTC 12251 / CI) TaxID=572480 RepID=D5V7H4_ARCNC|nr:ATP-grasp domain-containing protein [Arcobacter nitrofigilis]ADG94594.1 ATP-dependent carboxylate-amine ligase domain protein ATP-grasp [Arcobacter nitrofigilis DSM 7299]
MRKLFILGGSALQLDLILEAKKLFFYVIVLDMDKDCVGSRWCDEFLHIDICDKEAVLKKAIEYKIDAILTSATELGNITACYVGEKLGLNTNSYECALNTTNKMKMKEIFKKHNIKTANYKYFEKEDLIDWKNFPCIVKPVDSSGGRGLSYISKKEDLEESIKKAFLYSKRSELIIEEYILGRQFSVETISSNKEHQIITINEEFIREVPDILELGHHIPAKCSDSLKEKISQVTYKLLDIFDLKFGAGHIELRVTDNDEIYIVELASRTGGMRSEMINLAFGVSYSRLLLLSVLGMNLKLNIEKSNEVDCNFIIDYRAYEEYLNMKRNKEFLIFEPNSIKNVEKDFVATNLGESKGYYFILQNTKDNS